MLKIYGSMQCPDCVQCRSQLDAAGVCYDYLDFSSDLRNLKAFLSIRDKDPQFAAVREKGSIGIPCLVREDGSITLEWDEFL